jgi:hypothetical protein
MPFGPTGAPGPTVGPRSAESALWSATAQPRTVRFVAKLSLWHGERCSRPCACSCRGAGAGARLARLPFVLTNRLIPPSPRRPSGRSFAGHPLRAYRSPAHASSRPSAKGRGVVPDRSRRGGPECAHVCLVESRGVFEKRHSDALGPALPVLLIVRPPNIRDFALAYPEIHGAKLSPDVP